MQSFTPSIRDLNLIPVAMKIVALKDVPHSDVWTHVYRPALLQWYHFTTHTTTLDKCLANILFQIAFGSEITPVNTHKLKKAFVYWLSVVCPQPE